MTRVSNFIIRNDDAHAVAYEPIAKAGATGLRSATINPNLKGGKNDISMAISLRPSAVNSSIAPTGVNPTFVTAGPMGRTRDLRNHNPPTVGCLVLPCVAESP
jgi:hypothetical protein